MSDLNFSMFAMTNARHNTRYLFNATDYSQWYLIESTSKDLVSFTQTQYDTTLPYVTHADSSEDATVSTVTQYLIQPSPNQIPNSNQLSLLKQIFAYPTIVVYVYKDSLFITGDDNWTKLDWIFVLSVSEQVFSGDFDQYAALGVICVGGALIILAYIYSVGRRNFDFVITQWEDEYLGSLANHYGWSEFAQYSTKHFGLDDAQLFAQEERQLLRVLSDDKEQRKEEEEEEEEDEVMGIEQELEKKRNEEEQEREREKDKDINLEDDDDDDDIEEQNKKEGEKKKKQKKSYKKTLPLVIIIIRD
ncbi:hypothetical protein RFI_14892 [Reticulomyxa filosa]|uniref:Uncharacterized protein n=1 Tax=Reticulomyxa filosa TaxID=46433 RepID=X6N8D5_RETFI|nr:hypothetical protein RFI_14892 [Reticulomyxa filosa]|eukprot:ETO22306.1 hypothetical protein RFI_14892 [Reticulomyxa filosa]